LPQSMVTPVNMGAGDGTNVGINMDVTANINDSVGSV
jgi:hypothetical protein